MVIDIFELAKDNILRACEQLLGRSSGPFHMRLLMQPLMVIFLSIKSGLKDAKEGNEVYFFGSMGSKEGRRQLLKTGWKAIGKVIVMALILDIIYQIVAFHSLYVLQAIIVVLALAILPYLLIRGIVTRVASYFYKT